MSTDQTERERSIELAQYWVKYDGTNLESEELPHAWILARALLKEVEQNKDLGLKLRDVLGCSSCYCDRCSSISRDHWYPDEGRDGRFPKPKLRERVAELEAECEKADKQAALWNDNFHGLQQEHQTLLADNARLREALINYGLPCAIWYLEGPYGFSPPDDSAVKIRLALQSTPDTGIVEVVRAAEAIDAYCKQTKPWPKDIEGFKDKLSGLIAEMQNALAKWKGGGV